ncbi:MAG: hypothetical protein LBL55_08195 [Propionibacteriaceae bacterium]|jgi:dextranase|nr:hypothetical protein [Propionibacteriaceae bacterium]
MILLPSQTSYRPGDQVAFDLTEPRPGARLTITRLAEPVVTVAVNPAGDAVLVGALPEGAYGADLWSADGAWLASTAVDVRPQPLDRPRYGFQAQHGPGADPAATIQFARRLHLNAVQFYDWAWSHSRLLPPDPGIAAGEEQSVADHGHDRPGLGSDPGISAGEDQSDQSDRSDQPTQPDRPPRPDRSDQPNQPDSPPNSGQSDLTDQPTQPEQSYLDPLGNPVCLTTVRGLIAGLDAIGAAGFGYVAVYGIPRSERQEWNDVTLFRGDGQPYDLGSGFLTIADPSADRWREHLVAEIRRAVARVGFPGLHLDQYGWPKAALRADGTVTDLALSLPELLAQIAAAVPDTELIFNNVNGFPLEATARSRQAALYCEVWPPRTDYLDLADLVTRSRAAGPLPVIVSAYLSCYLDEPVERADQALKLAQATLFSGGASHLVAGQAGQLLTDPYYPRNHSAADSTVATLTRYADALVRYGDLLVAPEVVDVTGAYFGAYNGDIIVEGPPGLKLSHRPEPGAVWVRVTRGPAGLTVHLINLTDQTETAWDRGKTPVTPLSGLSLHSRRLRPTPVPVLAADPDRPGPMTALTGAVDGPDQVTALPSLGTWLILHLPRSAPSDSSDRQTEATA